MTDKEQQKAARTFAQRWQGHGYEKGESQTFWIELLSEVYGVEHPSEQITFEQQVKLDHTSFIDAYLPATHTMIEQKSIEKDLGAPIRQSDGSLLNPFQQAKRYAAELPYSQRPRWIVTCNFREFWVYDMEQPNGEPQKILLENLDKEYYRLRFLVDERSEQLRREMEVSIKAGELVGIIYDHLKEQYTPAGTAQSAPSEAEVLRSLNILCVRLVFCLYAEDAGLFANRTAFHDYLIKYGTADFRRALIDLFALLDTPLDARDPYLEDDIAAFPYVNGGLFSDEKIIIPRFTDELKHLLLQNASADFDWSEISPTIFGAVFESTLNPETRRSGGMHYTSIENIHKVIDPLFMDGLRAEYNKILEARMAASARRQALMDFQNRLASLTFLDPACGSGNFLTETFLSLRRLENEVIRTLYGGVRQLDFEGTIKVNIAQFYGIEINDFACTVAKTALWIAENQMLQETSAIVGVDLNFLPLKTNANIREGNALRMEWDVIEHADNIPTIYARNTYVSFEEEDTSMKVSEPTVQYEALNLVTSDLQRGPKPTYREHVHFDYIMGNPPFVGARMMSERQKEDMGRTFGKQWKNIGDLDYVCAWYKKAAELMQWDKRIKAALVSTNSITQGTAVANLWKPLFEQYHIHFDFAYQTFRWDSESTMKAAVHCVIIGFNSTSENQARTIYLSDGNSFATENINGYLMAAPNVWVTSRSKPLCDVPPLLTGSQRIDNDLFMFTDETKAKFLLKEPAAEKFFKVWYGADEFINNRPRWVLYLGGCSPAELKAMHHCYEIVRQVREYRLASKREATRKAADNPSHFGLEVIPSTNFMIVPVVSSERRRYVPLGFMSPDVMCSNQVNLIPDATLYHFGVLTSNVHMAWMRAVCGRLKSDYRYSKDIVYNNFPWPYVTEAQKERIAHTARQILDARAKYPDSSLADLYDELTMPVELRRAHQENDRTVMQAYGFPVRMTESECVTELFKLYQQLTSPQTQP